VIREYITENKLRKFISKPREPPSGKITHQPIILTDSKGNYLKKYACHDVEKQIVWLELQIYIDISLYDLPVSWFKRNPNTIPVSKIICTCTTIFLKFYNKCVNKNESGHHLSSC
jgi:hypothetical protein